VCAVREAGIKNPAYFYSPYVNVGAFASAAVIYLPSFLHTSGRLNILKYLGNIIFDANLIK